MPTHRVVAGDDLSSLARRYYGDASHWRLITTANAGVLGDADEGLRPGLLLIIPISTDDATGWAAAAADPAGPDGPVPTWPTRPLDTDDTDGSGRTAATAALLAGQPAAGPYGISIRHRVRLPWVKIIVATVIIALVIVAVPVFRAARQAQLERDLSDHLAIDRIDLRSKVVELDPDSTLAQLETIVAILMELRAYDGAGWEVRIGPAVLQTNDKLSSSAAQVLFGVSRVDSPVVVRLTLDPVSRSTSATRGEIAVDVRTVGPGTRAEAATVVISTLATGGWQATSAIDVLSVSTAGPGVWRFQGRPVMDPARTAAALRVIEGIGATEYVQMINDVVYLRLRAGSESDGEAACRRARDQLAALPPDLELDLQVATPERTQTC